MKEKQLILTANVTGNSLDLKIPLNQVIYQEKIARYIIYLYEFDFISEKTKCFITVEFNSHMIFKVTPDCYDDSFIRTFNTHPRMMPCSCFKDDLENAGFNVIETSETSWEISKK